MQNLDRGGHRRIVQKSARISLIAQCAALVETQIHLPLG
jgi:hypothetical protein